MGQQYKSGGFGYTNTNSDPWADPAAALPDPPLFELELNIFRKNVAIDEILFCCLKSFAICCLYSLLFYLIWFINSISFFINVYTNYTDSIIYVKLEAPHPQ